MELPDDMWWPTLIAVTRIPVNRERSHPRTNHNPWHRHIKGQVLTVEVELEPLDCKLVTDFGWLGSRANIQFSVCPHAESGIWKLMVYDSLPLGVVTGQDRAYLGKAWPDRNHAARISVCRPRAASE